MIEKLPTNRYKITSIKTKFSIATSPAFVLTTQLTHVYLSDEIAQGFENSMFMGMILIDLQKAFDTIDHEIFLEKMKHLGFADSVIFWFQSYLTNQTFFVNIRKDFSPPGELSCGVPQGSILGLLIFLLYVNDMPQAVDSDFSLYADDSCLVFGDNNVNEIEKRLNSNFNSLCDWFVDKAWFPYNCYDRLDRCERLQRSQRSQRSTMGSLEEAFPYNR